MQFIKSNVLKSCPLCGNRAQLTIHNGGRPVNVSCGVEDDDSDTCGLVLFGGNDDSKQDMIDRWNKRGTDTDLGEVAHRMSVIVHESCENVPHDIGIKLVNALSGK